MAFPVKQKIWTISPNNTIAFVSLLLTTAGYLKGMADFLIANGYTVKGSSDGVTAAMDGVNRWALVADAAVRGANTTSAQSWIVLTDGNGCDICIAYVGATDDVARFAYSPGGLYVAAGTATFTPTATDEAVIMTGISVIGATASAARIWNGWVDSNAQLCRFTINRSASLVGVAWGVELLDDRASVEQTWSPKVWGFGFQATNMQVSGAASFTANYSGNTRGGLVRIMGANIGIGGAVLSFMGNPTVNPWGNVQTENQGGVGYPMFGPFAVGSSNASRQGPLAYVFDWWSGRTGASQFNGDTYDALNYVQWGDTIGIVWPWDGVTVPNVGGGPSGAQLGNSTGFQNLPEEGYGIPNNGNLQYDPLAHNAVTPTAPGPVLSYVRRPGAEILRLNELAADPAPEAGRVLMYTRVIDGQQRLFALYPDGTLYAVGV